MKRLRLLLLCLAVLIVPRLSFASHAMGADISYKCIGPNTYEVFVTFFRDCEGIDAPDDIILDASNTCTGASFSITAFPDTLITTTNDTLYSGIEISPLCDAFLPLSSCVGGVWPGTEVYVYGGVINLPDTCANWVIGFAENARNAAIDNLLNPGSQTLYIEATIDNTDSLCNSSPTFSQLPVTYICEGVAFDYNHGAVDLEGDSLFYTMVQPLGGPGAPIPYAPTYSLPMPVISTYFIFDPFTGLLSFKPLGIQTCVITVLVEEFRDGVKIGSVMRDIEVVVVFCSNTVPYNDGGILNLEGGTEGIGLSVDICLGDTASFDLYFIDPDTLQNLTLEHTLPFVIPGATLTSTPMGPDTIFSQFEWYPTAADTGFYVFTITLTDDACPIIASQTFTVSIRVLTGTYAWPEQSLYCPTGDPIELHVVGGGSFTWFPPDGLDDPTSANPLATPTVTTVYTVVSDLTGSCPNNDQVTVIVDTTLAIDAGPDWYICYDDTITLPGSLTGNTVDSGFQFQWTPAAGLDDATLESPLASPDVTTTYVMSAFSDGGCILTDTVTVFVDSYLATGPVDTSACEGVVLNLSATGGTTTADYTWSGDAIFSCTNCPDPEITLTNDASLTVTVVKPDGCIDTFNFDVDYNIPVPVQLPEDTMVCPGEEFAITIADPVYTAFEWQPIQAVNLPTSGDVMVQVYVPTTLVVTSYDANGCPATDEMQIDLNSCEPVIIPNVFTPNYDGLNDVIKPINYHLQELYAFEIFNRWGERVFSTDRLDTGWDGTVQGAEAEIGTYVYQLRGVTYGGIEVNLQGTVTLLR